MRAVVLNRSAGTHAVGDFVAPAPAGAEVRVRVHASGLNPVDWKMAAYGFLLQNDPTVLGCDMSGVVDQVGPDASRLRVGDAVFGYTGLGKNGRGTFAEYCVADEASLCRKPDSLTHEAAATLSVSAFTAMIALFEKLGITPPDVSALPEPRAGDFLLVWGGSGSVGSAAVQLARLAGFTVIATCSPQNAALVTSLGASVVVDHRAPDAVDQIRAAAAGGTLRLAFDTISPATALSCANAVAGSPGALVACCAGVPTGALPDGVQAKNVMLGSSHDQPAEFIQLKQHARLLEAYVAAGLLQPQRVHQVEGGLEGVIPGLKLLQEGKVSGAKVVVTLASS